MRYCLRTLVQPYSSNLQNSTHHARVTTSFLYCIIHRLTFINTFRCDIPSLHLDVQLFLLPRIVKHDLKKKRFQRYNLWVVEGMSFPDCETSPRRRMEVMLNGDRASQKGEDINTSSATSVAAVGIVNMMWLLCSFFALPRSCKYHEYF